MPGLHVSQSVLSPGGIHASSIHALWSLMRAEFCGMQHAHMALDVVAESDLDFEQWLDGMRQPGREVTKRRRSAA